MKMNKLSQVTDFSTPCDINEIYNIKFVFTTGKYNIKNCQNIIARDSESSNGYKIKGSDEVVFFDMEKYDRGVIKTYNKDIEDVDVNDEDVKYKNFMDNDTTPVGLCYAHQIAIEDGKGGIKVFILRTYEELIDFDIKLYKEIRRQAVFGDVCIDRESETENALNKKLSVIVHNYYHNLGHDSVFLQNIYLDEFVKARGKNESVFARHAHKPMKITTMNQNAGVKVIYHDTAVLSQMSLKTWAHTCVNCPLEKVEDYNYNEIITPTTPLTEEQLKYMAVDVLIIVYCMEEERNQAGDLQSIPITQTGKLRKYLEQHCINKNKNWAINMGEISRSYSLDYYRELCAIYQGGYTHCSNLWSGICSKDVQDEYCRAYDFASSYPSCCFVKFAINGYDECSVDEFDELSAQDPDSNDIDYRWFAKIEVKGIKSKSSWSYWSTSKMYDVKDDGDILHIDNGRIHECNKTFTIWVTECDWKTFTQAYEVDDYKVLKMYKGKAEWLCKELLECILHFYKVKSEWKNVPGKEAELQYFKALLNAAYGLCCYKAISSEVHFNIDGWTKITLEEGGEEMFYKQLLQQKELSAVCFEMGITISSVARYRLWQFILHFNDKLIYTDTDSIKGFLDDNDVQFINEWNNALKERQDAIADELGFDRNVFAPKTGDGKTKRLGVFEAEHNMHIKALRAKAYLTWNEEDGYNLTLAGLPKIAGKKIKSFDDFTDETIWTTQESHKVCCYYNDNQGTTVWTDKNGDKYVSEDKYGVCLKPTTFNLDRTPEFKSFLNMLYNERLDIDDSQLGGMSRFLDLQY